jgi:CheY-like chemotaxis protein
MSSAADGILLADDDRVDAKAFMRALRKLGVAHTVTVARDGLEAWEMLNAAGQSRPGLIVLDINMPRLSGLELLRRIRADEALRDAPVFILTTSDDEGDRLDALELNVTGYIVKSELGPGLARALALTAPL